MKNGWKESGTRLKGWDERYFENEKTGDRIHLKQGYSEEGHGPKTDKHSTIMFIPGISLGIKMNKAAGVK